MTLAQLVRRERSRLGLALAARGMALALALLALVIAVSALALGDARWIKLPSVPLLVWALALVLVAVVLWWTQHSARRSAAESQVAREIERERSLRAGSLRGVLETAGSGALGAHAADALASRLVSAGKVLAPGLRRRALRRGALAAIAAAAAMAFLGAARARAPDGWRALRHPVGALTGSILAPLRIVDPPRAIVRGEKLRLTVSAPERNEITLHTRATGRPWSTLTLPVKGGAAAAALGPVDADLTLVASDGRVTSDTLVVRVTDRPFVGDVAIRATYPSYLRRPAETIPVGEPARVPRGTALAISGRASIELRNVGLAGERDTLPLEPAGHAFTGRLRARESGRWSWFATSAQGPIAELPAPLELEVLADSAPHVEILAPGGDTVVLAGARIALRAAAVDDHGLASVELRSRRRLANGRVMPELSQELAVPRAPGWTGEPQLDLAARGLEPGDELLVRVVATDNSPWRQKGASREVAFRIPSLSEQRSRARALADSTVSRISAAAKAERELAQRTSEAARSRADRGARRSASSDWSNGEEEAATPRSMSYQSAEQAKTLAKEQRDLHERVRQAQRDAKLLEEQLSAAGVLDSSLTRQLRDVQRLLRDALTPELQRQLEDVLKATNQLSAEETRRALQNLAKQQEQLRKQLERTAEMLKRAALEGAMQSLHDEARDIARQERATGDSLARSAGRPDSTDAKRANELSQRSERLSRDVSELSKRLRKEQAESGPRKLQGASQRADSSAAAMRSAAQAGSGDRAQRAEAAKSASSQMQKAAEQLGEARKSQIEEWKNQITSELDRSIQETMQLAREQQDIARRARSPEGNRQEIRADQSAVQQGVEKVQERLQKAARRSAHISPQSQGALGAARRSVQEVTRQVAEGETPGSSGERGIGREQTVDAMGSAAQALNRAAAEMMKDRARAARGSSASGFAEMVQRMREAAKQQGGVNQQSAGLLPVPGAQPTPRMMAQARQLAKRQREIARGLEGAGRDEGGAGRAEQLAREMREIAEALDRGRVDPALLQRQQALFHRLLDAGLTLEKDEREDTGERESETAVRDEAVTSGTQSSGRSVERYRQPTWRELKGLTADERRAVLEYFKRINAEKKP